MTSSSDWDEIKRLAADFQKAQLCSTVQRLSERNCIEIVTKLIELKLIDVIFTIDGKEYLTSQQLVKEIKDELYVHGGRINIVELAKELNVDLSQINAVIPQVIKEKTLQLVSGYLIGDYYLEKVAGEINEKLQLQGVISVNELTLAYDLPAELIQHNILEHFLGTIVRAKQDPSDPKTFYTDEYINRTKSKIRGALIGLLKPTPVTVIINHCNLSDRLFMSLFDLLNAPGTLTGRQAGALYVPYCYTKSQNEWVLNFFKQNNYLDYDALSRLGVLDPKNFIKRLLSKEDLIFLNTCVIGSQIRQQLENELEETISSKSFLDVVTLLPSIVTDSDIQAILEELIKKHTKTTILFDNIVFSNNYIEELRKLCQPVIQKNAEGFVKSGKYKQYYIEQQMGKVQEEKVHVDQKAERRDERRRKAASGKGGGGTQGRETKTKAVKKHQRSKQTNDSDSDDASTNKKAQSQLEIVTVENIEEAIVKKLEQDSLEDYVNTIAEYLYKGLNQSALIIAKELAERILQDSSQSRKQTHSATQDKVNILVNDIKLYEKGIKLFAAEQQAQFVKYLLKRIGGDLLTEFCRYAAGQTNKVLPEEPTIEQRNKLVNDLPDEYKIAFKSLQTSLNDVTLEPFYQAVDECLASCEMILKKVDKKKDKSLILNHREKLISELDTCDDPALALHLTVLAVFTTVTQNMLYASGKLVPVIVAFLKSHLKNEDYNKLTVYLDDLTKYLVVDEESRSDLKEKLISSIPMLKSLVADVKKY